MKWFNTKYLAYTLAGLILGAWIAHGWSSHDSPHGTYQVYAEILGNPVPTAIGTFELQDSIYVDPQTGVRIPPKNLFEMIRNEELNFVPLDDPDHASLYTVIIEHLTEIIIALVSCIAPILVGRSVASKKKQ